LVLIVVVAVLKYASQAEAVLEAAPDAILGVDPGGQILLMNAQAERLFGYSRDELIGQAVEVLVPEAIRGMHPGLRSRYLADPALRPMGVGKELAGRRKDGSEFPAEISLSAVRTDEGLMVAASVRDVSDRKNAEAERLMIEGAPDAILGVDASGSIELVNAQCERLFRYDRADLIGQPVEILIPVGLRPVEAGQVGAGLEVTAVCMGGARIVVEVSLSALETAGGRLTMAAVRDITDRRRFEGLLREQNIELERASRAKDNFLASMSHELRTPLNAIIGFTGTMLMKLPGPLNAEQEHQLRLVQASGKHLLSIINDLLDLAKIESGKVQVKLEPVDCRGVAEEVVQSLQPLAEGKGILLGIDGASTPVVVTADRRVLGQILINLVNNAIKFTDTGQVRVCLIPPSPDGGVRISVGDTGPGIPEADLARIFRAFERSATTAKSSDEGTGLGLHISQKLAGLLRATLSVASVVGEGSTFTVSLADAQAER
jgi:protein-histidine pros-kinase